MSLAIAYALQVPTYETGLNNLALRSLAYVIRALLA
jgi:hypothetical protein